MFSNERFQPNRDPSKLQQESLEVAKSLGRQLQAIREGRGITHEAVAEALALSPHDVRQIELGGGIFQDFLRICDHLSLDYCLSPTRGVAYLKERSS